LELVALEERGINKNLEKGILVVSVRKGGV
jgi:hypothetical protein